MTATIRRTVLDFGHIAYSGPHAVNAATLEIEISDRNGKGPELSICGNIWNARRTDIECGGQCLDTMLPYLAHDPRFVRLHAIWQRWHLNGMNAGCEHQRAEKWSERPIDPSKPTNAYGKHYAGQQYPSWNMLIWVRRSEHPEGLMCEPCPTCGYKYGTAWLHEELPAEVIAEVRSLLGAE